MFTILRSLFNPVTSAWTKLYKLICSAVPEFETMRPYLRIVLTFTRPKYDTGGFDEEEVRQRVEKMLDEIAMRPYMDEIRKNREIARKAGAKAALKAGNRNSCDDKNERHIASLDQLSSLSEETAQDSNPRKKSIRKASIQRMATTTSSDDPLDLSSSHPPKPKSALRRKPSTQTNARAVHFLGPDKIHDIPTREEEGNTECTYNVASPGEDFPEILEELDEALAVRTPLQHCRWFYYDNDYIPRDHDVALNAFRYFSESEPRLLRPFPPTARSRWVSMTRPPVPILSGALPIRLAAVSTSSAVPSSVAASTANLAPPATIEPSVNENSPSDIETHSNDKSLTPTPTTSESEVPIITNSSNNTPRCRREGLRSSTRAAQAAEAARAVEASCPCRTGLRSYSRAAKSYQPDPT
ncbi:hypothetical protein BROUX41_004225 [Berkeleyomyces rouxiae]